MVAHGAAPSTTMTPTSVRFTRRVHAIAMLHLVAMLDVGGLDVGGGSGGMFGIGGTQQHSSYEVLVGSPVEKEGGDHPDGPSGVCYTGASRSVRALAWASLSATTSLEPAASVVRVRRDSRRGDREENRVARESERES